MKIATQNWDEILSFYQNLRDNYQWEIEPIVDLVSMINNSIYKHGVYGYTSHAILCIGQHPELEDNDAILKIEHDPNKGEITFSYKGDNTLKFTWHKSFPESNVISEFERFIQEMKWF